MREKYVVYPGPVVSPNDTEEHWITAQELMRLYGVAPGECVIVHERHPDRQSIGTMGTERHKDLIPLCPDPHGNYEIPDPDSDKGGGALESLQKKLEDM